MTQMESTIGKAEKSSSSGPMSPEFVEMGKNRLEKLASTQKELLDEFQKVNRGWFDRMQSEARMASELATKLTTVNSLPETATIYQEWVSRRMEMAAEDAKRLLADSQKFMETGAHLLSNNWLSGGSSTRT